MKRAELTKCLAGCAALALAAPSCAPMSLQQEIELGDQYAQEINQQLPMVDDPVVNLYMNNLGTKIARSADPRNLTYHFHVVNSDVVNAFAIPGGYVYINRALIERADLMAEVAGVTAHEIGHVVARHGAEQLARLQTANLGLALGTILLGQPTGASRTAIELGGAAIFTKYSRDQEREADSLAVHFLIATGIDPDGMASMFQKLLEEREAKPSALEQFFSTHPLSEERIQNAQRLVASLPEAQAEGLQLDSPRFHEVQERLRSLPPPPDAGG